MHEIDINGLVWDNLLLVNALFQIVFPLNLALTYSSIPNVCWMMTIMIMMINLFSCPVEMILLEVQ